jgi:hypothetical protein
MSSRSEIKNKINLLSGQKQYEQSGNIAIREYTHNNTPLVKRSNKMIPIKDILISERDNAEKKS